MYKVDSVVDFLQVLSSYLDKIKRCFPVMVRNSLVIDSNITVEDIFSGESLAQLIHDFNVFCEEKNAFIKELNDFSQKDDTTENSPLMRTSLELIRRHSERETEFQAVDLCAAGQKVFCLLNHIYSRLLMSSDDHYFSPPPLNAIQDIAKKFETHLNHLSDYIEELKIPARAIPFSLGRYSEKLEKNYEKGYQMSYPYTYWIRKWGRYSDRLKDIHFIMKVSTYLSDVSEINDADRIRYAVMYSVVLKIQAEPGDSKNTSVLKKVLEAGLERTIDQTHDRSRVIEKVRLFCERQPIVVPSENLNNFINQI